MSVLNTSPTSSSESASSRRKKLNEFAIVGNVGNNIIRRRKFIRIASVVVAFLGVTSLTAGLWWFGSNQKVSAKIAAMQRSQDSLSEQAESEMTTTATSETGNNTTSAESSGGKVTRIACIGNSIQYYNDQPRLLELLGNGTIQQDSCLRGGASLNSILSKGNGMGTKFHTDNAQIFNATTADVIGYDIGSPTVYELLLGHDLDEEEDATTSAVTWDYAIMNDYTQAPARAETRSSTIVTLMNEYAPMLVSSKAIPVFLMTWAYHVEGLKNSTDLGNFANFTQLLKEGYEDYAQALGTVLPASQAPRIAPVGLAFYKVYQENEDMW
jgi:hypothetical protein